MSVPDATGSGKSQGNLACRKASFFCSVQGLLPQVSIHRPGRVGRYGAGPIHAEYRKLRHADREVQPLAKLAASALDRTYAGARAHSLGPARARQIAGT